VLFDNHSLLLAAACDQPLSLACKLSYQLLQPPSSNKHCNRLGAITTCHPQNTGAAVR
jgi:hypothetical protein